MLYLRDRQRIDLQNNNIQKNISVKQVSQLKLNTTKHQMFTKQYKTKNFDSKAEQWRTEQEISGKFIKYTHKFKRRPRKLKKFVVVFEFCAQYSSRIELAGSKNAGKRPKQH